MPLLLELGSELDEVVDFAVVDDPHLAIGTRHWLMAGRAQIDDAQSRVDETDTRGRRKGGHVRGVDVAGRPDRTGRSDSDAPVVRATMSDSATDGPQERKIESAVWQ